MKILCHQGLGDHIIMNGLVRATLARCGDIQLPVRACFLDTVRFMYRDCPGIELVTIPADEEHYRFQHRWGEGDGSCLRLGLFDPHWHRRLETHRWDEVFYLQAGLAIEDRWTHFRCQRSPEREQALCRAFGVSPGAYQLVHDDPTRAFHIDLRLLDPHLPVLRLLPPIPGGGPYPTSANLFDYATLAQEAAAIHCMGSSLFCLVEALPMPAGTPLALHDYIRPTPMSRFRYSWTVHR
jgi:hypothetical protein